MTDYRQVVAKQQGESQCITVRRPSPKSPNLSVPSLWEEGTVGSTTLRGCFEFVIESASNGGKGCLVELQETEVLTPTSCAKFVLMSCEVGDWSDWTIQE